MKERLKALLLEQEAADAVQRGPCGALGPRRGSKPGGVATLPAHLEGSKGRGGWGGQTHSTEQRHAIEKGNMHLVNRLTEVATRNGTPATAAPHAGPKKSSNAINRQKEQVCGTFFGYC